MLSCINADVSTEWDESAAAAAETLLPMMCDWLVRRQPWRYKRDADGGVSVPSLAGGAVPSVHSRVFLFHLASRLELLKSALPGVVPAASYAVHRVADVSLSRALHDIYITSQTRWFVCEA